MRRRLTTGGALLLLAAGCGTADDLAPLTPGAGGAGGASPSTSTGQPMPMDGATLHGLVLDERGAPLVNAFLGLCADACWAKASDAVPTLYVPDPGPGQTLSPGPHSVDVGDGLTLSVDITSWTLPFGFDAPFLAGKRVPEAQWPPNPVPEGEVLARWALNPYGTISDSPWPSPSPTTSTSPPAKPSRSTRSTTPPAS